MFSTRDADIHLDLWEWEITNPQCAHLFFCGAGREWYYKRIPAYEEHHEKVTIVQGGVPDEELETMAIAQVKFASLKFTMIEAIDDEEDFSSNPDSEFDSSSRPEPVSIIA